MPIGAAIAGSLTSAVVGSVLAPHSQDPGQAQRAIDPFAPYRANYAQQLNMLLGDPTRVQALPGFQAELGLGKQTVERTLAARGQVGSGAEQIALQNLGMAQQGKYFNEEFNRLATLSGAGQSPAAGGMAFNQAQQQQIQNQQQLAGAFGSIAGYGVGAGMQQGGWLNNLFTSSPSTTSTSVPSSGWSMPTTPTYGASPVSISGFF